MRIPQKKVRGKRPTKPRRTLPGIAAVFSAGRWRWRACVTVRVFTPGGVPVTRQCVGPLRDSQRAAFDDVDRVRAEAEAKDARPKPPTVLEGLNAAIQRKIDEGLAPHSIQGDWRNPAKAVIRRFRGEALLETLTVEVLRRWAASELEAGLAPRTVAKGRLGVVHHAFLACGLPSPVPEVKAILKQALRPRDVEVPAYTVDELRVLLAAVRDWRPEKGRRADRRELDVLLIELVAMTGIRHDELARIRKRDVWLQRRMIVVMPKVRRRTREEPIPADLVPRIVERLAELRSDDGHLVPGYGVARENEPAWAPQVRYLNRMRERWKERLGDRRFSLRALRRGHGTGLDHLGAPFSVVRDALGHTRTSQETTRYLHAGKRAVTAAKQDLAEHLLLPPVQGPPPPPRWRPGQGEQQRVVEQQG